MKFGSGTIGTLLFTAVGTAAFVWMAKRPAVDATAMKFGMPNASQTSAAATTTATKSGDAKDKTAPGTSGNANPPANTETSSTSNPTTDPATKNDKSVSNNAPADNADNKIPVNDSTPASQNTPDNSASENNQTPANVAPVNNGSSVSENAPSIAPPIAPVEKSPPPATIPTPVMDTPTPPAETAPVASSLNVNDIKPMNQTNPASTEVTPDAPEKNITPETGSAPENSKQVLQTTTTPDTTDTTAKTNPGTTKMIKVPTNQVFGNSLPSYITDQLPEMIDVPIEHLLDRSAPPESVVPQN